MAGVFVCKIKFSFSWTLPVSESKIKMIEKCGKNEKSAETTYIYIIIYSNEYI